MTQLPIQSNKALWLTDKPILCGALVSALSTLIIILSSSGINADATLYLITADAFKTSGWEAAEALYSRPFYSVLIGSLSQATQTSSFTSALILNTSLLALLGCAFVGLVKDLGGNQRAQWIAVLMIILFPSLSKYRDYLIRDFGYWAFTLLGLSAIIKFQLHKHYSSACQWLIYFSIAALFRPEASIILVLIPTSLLVSNNKPLSQRIKQMLYLYGTLFCALIITAGIGFIFELELISKLENLTIKSFLEQAESLNKTLSELSQNLANNVLNRHSEEHANLALSLVFTGIFIKTMYSAITPLLVLVIIYLWRKGQFKIPKNSPYIATHLILSCILIGFLLNQQFLQSRYMFLSALLLLVPICIGLSRDYENLSLTRPLKYTAILFISIIIIDNHVSLKNPNSHVKESIQWLQSNTPSNAWIHSNEHQIAYFSGRDFSWPHINHAKRHMANVKIPLLKGYDYIALEAGRKDKALQEFGSKLPEQGFTLVASFSNQRKDTILIFNSASAAEIRKSKSWNNAVNKRFQNPNY